MEAKVFPKPAVAGLLKAKFVESRLHVDLRKHLTAEQFAANKALQKQYTTTIAMPYFVIVDPKTGTKLREMGLGPNQGQWEADFLKFLQGE